jgi:hypothetical protein
MSPIFDEEPFNGFQRPAAVRHCPTHAAKGTEPAVNVGLKT